MGAIIQDAPKNLLGRTIGNHMVNQNRVINLLAIAGQISPSKTAPSRRAKHINANRIAGR